MRTYQGSLDCIIEQLDEQDQDCSLCDESCFIRDKIPNSPVRTERKLSIDKKWERKLSVDKNFQSQKFLDFEQITLNPAINLKEIRNLNTVGFQTPNINNVNHKYAIKSPITPALERIKWINFYSKSNSSPKVDKYFLMISNT